MSRALRSALIASLENDAETINPLTDHQETNIDEVLLEINDAEAPVTEADQVVDVLETAEVAIEAIAASLEAHIEEGGMSPQTARSHNVAMENALRGLPIDADSVNVSSEAFGGHGDKLSASMEAMEKIKETLAKLWEGIKNAVKKAWNAVKTFIATIGTSSRAIKAAGQDLIKRAGSTKGKAEGKMNGLSITKALHVGGDLKGSVGSALAAIVTGGTGVVASAKAAEAGMKEVAGAIAAGRPFDNAEMTDFAKKVDGPLPTNELPGGRKIEFNDSGVAVLGTGSKVNKVSVEMAVPSIEEIKAIGQGIVKVADFLDTYSNRTFKDLEKSVEQFIAQQDKLVAKAGFDKEETAKTRGALKGVNKISNLARGCGPQYLSYAAGAAKAAYSFGKSALGQYKAA